MLRKTCNNDCLLKIQSLKEGFGFFYILPAKTSKTGIAFVKNSCSVEIVLYLCSYYLGRFLSKDPIFKTSVIYLGVVITLKEIFS